MNNGSLRKLIAKILKIFEQLTEKLYWKIIKNCSRKTIYENFENV